jgi:hypothetical protein
LSNSFFNRAWWLLWLWRWMCLFLVMGGNTACAAPEDGSTRLTAQAQALAPDSPRYGLNLGGPSSWGAEQLLSNIVANPGFEAILDRSIAIVAQPTSSGWVEADPWVQRSNGFWRGAQATVLSGVLAGLSLTVVDHQVSAPDQAGRFLADTPLLGLKAGDAISLLQARSATMNAAPARWWAQGGVMTRAGTRPQGLGQQVAVLRASLTGGAAQLSSYVDTLERAGRLLPVQGAWRLSFWVRAVDAPARLRWRFAREGQTVFTDESLTVQTEWTLIERVFNADEAPQGIGNLSLGFTVDQGELELDDVYLGETGQGLAGFRQALVYTLKALSPGYLRDWQGQLGDTALNRFASDEARQPVRYRQGDSEVLQTYSVPQLLALSAHIGAQPWLILPSTLSVAEAQDFGRRLRVAMHEHAFTEVLLEFGNENWNPLFRPAGLSQPAIHADAAKRALLAAKAGFYASGTEKAPQLRLVVNARVGDPALSTWAQGLSWADRIAVAPYFMHSVSDTTPVTDALGLAFEAARQPPAGAALTWPAELRGKQAHYELNWHTTEGDMSAFKRNTLVAGAASGSVLAAHLLTHTLQGVREQAVYSVAGFDVFSVQKESVHLFGVVRDLGRAGRWRPTGWVLAGLNLAAGGAVFATDCQGTSCDKVVAAVFQGQQGGRRWAIVNTQAQRMNLRLTQACAQGVPVSAWLDGSVIERHNEEETPQVEAQTASVHCEGTDAHVPLAAYSTLVLIER